MCGIVGFAGCDHEPAVLRKMNRSLMHRGPDEEGYFFRPGVGLAMRRLSIIDVKGGHQPIANEDETVWTVFNGEIYNFQELRKDLLAAGHKFRTHHSDTETIVHAYEEYGEDFVRRLNGMFAIAIWDTKKRRLLLYRDRIGEKPLYFHRSGKAIYFASEIKAILALPSFRRELNPAALFFYLGMKNSPREHSFFQGIEVLNPGEYLVFERGSVRKKFYWEIDTSEEIKISEEAAAAEIRRLLKDSVRMRMVSDVPLGAYLSGGVDSSAVVGFMSKIRKKPIETFSLTYKDNLSHKEKDQIAAAQMSKRFHTRHREYRMGHQEFVEDIEKVIASFDEPFGGTISTFFLSKLIRRHVKVAISGDGADEMFGSYKVHRMAYPMMALNRFIKKGILPENFTERELAALVPFDNDLSTLLQFRANEPHQWHAKLAVYSDEEKRKVLGARTLQKVSGLSTEDYYRKAYARTQTDDVLNQVLQVECQNLLPDQVLTFVDRLSMAHSVEVRPPFLDHRLIEFAFQLPGEMKIKGAINKYILKRAVSGLLPRSIINRPKEGFILPYPFWMRQYMCDKIRRALGPKELGRHGLFDAKYVGGLLSSYENQTLGGSNKIFLLFMFQLWWKRYFG